jgi:hypothetical protein
MMAPSGDLAMTPSERVFCLANMKHTNRCNRKQASGIAESDDKLMAVKREQKSGIRNHGAKVTKKT